MLRNEDTIKLALRRTCHIFKMSKNENVLLARALEEHDSDLFRFLNLLQPNDDLIDQLLNTLQVSSSQILAQEDEQQKDESLAADNAQQDDTVNYKAFVDQLWLFYDQLAESKISQLPKQADLLGDSAVAPQLSKKQIAANKKKLIQARKFIRTITKKYGLPFKYDGVDRNHIRKLHAHENSDEYTKFYQEYASYSYLFNGTHNTNKVPYIETHIQRLASDTSPDSLEELRKLKEVLLKYSGLGKGADTITDPFDVDEYIYKITLAINYKTNSVNKSDSKIKKVFSYYDWKINQVLAIPFSKIAGFFASGGYVFSKWGCDWDLFCAINQLYSTRTRDKQQILSLEQIKSLEEVYKGLSNGSNYAEKYNNQLKFLTRLCKIFEEFARATETQQDQNAKSSNEAFLKKLKKHINQFAENNHLPKLLFNLDKLVLNEEFDNVIAKDDLAFRKYIYLAPQEDQRFFSNHVNYDKKRKRIHKLIINCFATILSVIVGIGEASVATALAGHLALPALLGIFATAFVVNFFLLRGAVIGTTRNVFFNGLLTDANGNELSRAQNIGICVILASNFIVGLLFMCLSYSSTTSLIALTGLAISPGGAAAIAMLLAGATALGLMYLFSCGFYNFIRNEGYIDLISHFYQKFGLHNFENKSIGEIVVQSIKMLQRVAIYTLALGLWLSVSIGSAPFFALKMSNFITSMFHVGTTQADLTSKVLCYGPGSFNSYFYADGIFRLASVVADLNESLIDNIIDIPNKLKNAWDWTVDKLSNPINSIASITTADIGFTIDRGLQPVYRVTEIITPGPNALGQDNSTRSVPSLVDKFCQFFHLSVSVVSEVLKISSFTGSYANNVISLGEATAPLLPNTNAAVPNSVLDNSKSNEIIVADNKSVGKDEVVIETSALDGESQKDKSAFKNCHRQNYTLFSEKRFEMDTTYLSPIHAA